MKKWMKSKKVNNEGMTLVEVLIAMVIVSGVSVFLMYCFVQVAKYSAKGRELQQTTVIAQTVMENCKAYNLEQIETKFKSATDTFLKGTYANGCTYKYVEPKTEGTDSHHFYIQNIVADNQKFGVHLKLTPMNTQTVNKLENINPRRDGVFIAQSTEMTDINGGLSSLVEIEEQLFVRAMQQIATEVDTQTSGLVTLTADEVMNSFFTSSDPINDAANPECNYGKFSVQRQITIEASTGVDGDEADVSVVFYFNLVNDKYYVQVPGETDIRAINCASMTDSITVPVPDKIYTNKITKNADLEDTEEPMKLENIYFFYTPAYITSTEYPYGGQEVIEIVNNLKNADGTYRDLNVYLIKQKKKDVLDTVIGIAEASYKPSITGNGSGKVHLYHNLKENIGTPGNSLPGWSETNVNITNEGVISTDIIGSESKELMYQIDIELYRNGELDEVPEKNDTEDEKNNAMSGTKVLTLDGTKINW